MRSLKCPSCKQAGIKPWRKIFAVFFSAVKCDYCNSKLQLTTLSNLVIYFVGVIVVFVVIYISMKLQSWFPLVLIPVFFMLANLFAKFEPKTNRDKKKGVNKKKGVKSSNI